MEKQRAGSPKYSKQTTNLISIVLTLVILGALGKYLYDNIEIFESLQALNLTYLAVLFLIYPVFILNLSYLTKLIIHKLDPNISASEIIALQFINNLLNKILPKGGVAFRAMYLKRHHQLSYAHFLATFTGVVVAGFPAQAIVSLLAMLVIFLTTGAYNLVLILVFVAILFGSLIIMVLRPSIRSSGNWVMAAAQRLVEGWNLIVENPKDLLKYVAISLGSLLIDAFNLFMVFKGLGTPVTFSAALILSSLSIILSFINITPDGLGVREGVYLFMDSIVAIPEPQILLGSLVQRGISFLAAVLLGSISYLFLRKSRKDLTA